MDTDRTGPRRWAAQLWADARQGVVGGIAWVAAAAVAVALIGVLAGEVPAWLLPVAFILGAAIPTLALSAVRRSHDKQRGQIEEFIAKPVMPSGASHRRNPSGTR